MQICWIFFLPFMIFILNGYMQGKLNYSIDLSQAQMSSNQRELNNSSQAIAHSINTMNKKHAIPSSHESLDYPPSQNLSDEVRLSRFGKLPSIISNSYPASRQEQAYGSQSLHAGIPFYGEQNLPASYNITSFERKQPQTYCCFVCLNILLYFLIAVSVILVLTAFRTIPYLVIPLFGLIYLFYLCSGCYGNPLGKYCSNMKTYSSFPEQYSEMRRKAGNIKLTAECYHLAGAKHPKRIVTHTAVQYIPLRECIDIIQQAPDMNQDKRYILCDINRYFCFGDEDSHNTFLNTFAAFRNNNAFDLHQEYTHALELNIPNNIGLTVNGSGQCLQPMFYLFLLLGLGCFYLHFIQCLSQRYSINIKKKLTI